MRPMHLIKAKLKNGACKGNLWVFSQGFDKWFNFSYSARGMLCGIKIKRPVTVTQ